MLELLSEYYSPGFITRGESLLTVVVAVALLGHGQSDMMRPKSTDLVPRPRSLDAGPSHTGAGGCPSCHPIFFAGRGRWGGVVQLVVFMGLDLTQLESFPVARRWSGLSHDCVGGSFGLLRLDGFGHGEG